MSTIITKNTRGTAFTLPNGSAGVMSGIELAFTKRKELKIIVNTVAVAAIQCCISNGHDDSAIRKLMTGLIAGGMGKGGDYHTYKLMLEACGLYCDFEGANEKKESINNELVINKKKFKAILQDEGKKAKMYDMLYDVLNTDNGMWDTFQAAPDKRPNSARGKGKQDNEDEQAGEVSDVAAIDVALAPMRAALLEVAGTDPKRTEQILRVAMRLVEIGITMEQPANMDQVLQNQGLYSRFEKAPKADKMVALVKKQKAEQSAAA